MSAESSENQKPDSASSPDVPQEKVTTPNASDWWKGFFDAARNKSAEVLEYVKKDLDELSSTVKAETTDVVNQTTTFFKETLQLDKPESTASSMKQSVSSFFGQVSNVLNPSPEDEDEEAIMVHGTDVVPLTKLQQQIYALGNDPDTFLKEIEPEYQTQFNAWLEILEENDNKDISTDKLIKMLVNNPQLQNNYETLVPNKISHALFWNRYLFRKAMLEDEDAKQKRKERRGKTGDKNVDDVDDEDEDEEEGEEAKEEEDIWDKDGDFTSNVELSEADQIKLLEDYEKEKRNKKIAKEKEPIPNKKSTDDLKIKGTDHLKMRDKKDMVIIGDSSLSTTSSLSSSKESTEGDWDKEINMDDIDAAF